MYVGLGAVARARAADDTTPFLVGGWFHDATLHVCSGGIGPVPVLLGGCDTTVGADAPRMEFPGPQGRMYWGDVTLPRSAPPSIVRVHTHDARARDCPVGQRAACRLVLVVDDVVWSGDDVTRTAPRSVPEAVSLLGGVYLLSEFPLGPKSTLSVDRWLGVTAPPTACAAPWPRQTYAIHDDARLGLLAVFSDTASREAAQASLDPGVLPCGLDPRVSRPGAARFVAVENVLILVYDQDVADHLTTYIADPTVSQKYVPLPDASVDESFHLVDDVEALRLAGDVETLEVASGSDGNWNTWQEVAVRRAAANALTYQIEDGQAVAAPDLPAATWEMIHKSGTPGSARRFVIHHRDSTDPALATEILVAFRLVHPDVDTWRIVLVAS